MTNQTIQQSPHRWSTYLKQNSRLAWTSPRPPPQKTQAGQAPVGKVRGGIQRATTLARGVEGDVIHRVQKVREISSVVLDEAGYDPSLRFLLVACALFVVFLIIVVLNKIIT
jgi:hypothetical protein